MMDLTKLDNIVGMEKQKRIVRESAIVCSNKKTRFPHTLLIGNSGCGKTQLSRTLADLIGARFREYHGRSLSEDKNTIATLQIAIRNLNPEDNAILFIDEVHQLKPVHQEMFFPMMEKENLTIIAATTDPGKLVKPFQNRFELKLTISDYSQEDSIEIIARYCYKNNVNITPEAVIQIALRGRGVPRVITDLIDRCHNKAEFIKIQNGHDESPIVNEEICNLTFEDLEISENGLTSHENKLIQILMQYQQLAVRTLCSMSEIDLEQYERNYEPYLLKLGFIEKTPKGRKLTMSGIDYGRKLNTEFAEW